MADEPEKKDPTVEEQLAALKQQLAAAEEARAQDKARLETYEGTLRALGQGREQPAAQPQAASYGYNVPAPTQEDVRFLKQLYPDATDDQLVAYARQRAAELAYFARPIVNQVYGALGQTADILDRHEAMTDDDLARDYKPNKKEVEALRQEYLQSGRAVPPRAELTAIVKARKLPELVRVETERALAADAERRAAAASATTETTVGTARENPAAKPTKPLAAMTDEERSAKLAAMSREDRTKALEDAIGDTPIP
jgi:hypothetical protein